jgi:cyclopropane fatty-acyl-phospholipid synthase-like methyltransferase
MRNMELDRFYDENNTEDWKIVLGDMMHYHFGKYDPSMTDNIFENAVLEICNLIDENSKILDCGCGWGGPARYIMKNKNCEVVGLTISRNQKEYIQDFPVILANMETYRPEETYDYALFIESISHVKDFSKIVKNISPNVNSIIIKDYQTTKKRYNFDENWNMHFRPIYDFYKPLVDNGYKIKYYKKITGEELKKNLHATVLFWRKNIQKLPKEKIVGQIKLLEVLSSKFFEILHDKEMVFDHFLMCATKEQ